MRNNIKYLSVRATSNKSISMEEFYNLGKEDFKVLLDKEKEGIFSYIKSSEDLADLQGVLLSILLEKFPDKTLTYIKSVDDLGLFNRSFLISIFETYSNYLMGLIKSLEDILYMDDILKEVRPFINPITFPPDKIQYIEDLSDFTSFSEELQLDIISSSSGVNNILSLIKSLEDFLSISEGALSKIIEKDSKDTINSFIQSFNDFIKLGGVKTLYVNKYPRRVFSLINTIEDLKKLDFHDMYFLIKSFPKEILKHISNLRDLISLGERLVSLLVTTESIDLSTILKTKEDYNIIKSFLDTDDLEISNSLINLLPNIIKTFEDYQQLDKNEKIKFSKRFPRVLGTIVDSFDRLILLDPEVGVNLIQNNYLKISRLVNNFDKLLLLGEDIKKVFFKGNKKETLNFISSEDTFNLLSLSERLYLMELYPYDFIKYIDNLIPHIKLIGEKTFSVMIEVYPDKVKKLINSLQDFTSLRYSAKEQFLKAFPETLNYFIKSFNDFTQLDTDSQQVYIDTQKEKFGVLLRNMFNFLRLSYDIQSYIANYHSDILNNIVKSLEDFNELYPDIQDVFIDLYPEKYDVLINKIPETKKDLGNLEYIRPEVYEFFRDLELKGIYSFNLFSLGENKKFKSIFNYYINKYTSNDIDAYIHKLMSENPRLQYNDIQRVFYKDIEIYKKSLISKIKNNPSLSEIPVRDLLDLEESREEIFHEVKFNESTFIHKSLLGFKSLIKNSAVIKRSIWRGGQKPFKNLNNVFIFCVPFEKVSEGIRAITLADATTREEIEQTIQQGHIIPEEALKKSAIDTYMKTSNHPKKEGFLTIGWVRYTIFNKNIWVDEVQTDLHKVLGKEFFNSIFKEIELPYIFMKNFIKIIRSQGFEKIYYPTYNLATTLYNRSRVPKLPYTLLPEKLRFKEGIVEDLDYKIDGEKVWVLAKKYNS